MWGVQDGSGGVPASSARMSCGVREGQLQEGTEVCRELRQGG